MSRFVLVCFPFSGMLALDVLFIRFILWVRKVVQYLLSDRGRGGRLGECCACWILREFIGCIENTVRSSAY